jgi:peptidoglycan DL-endopeptidase CwlO
MRNKLFAKTNMTKKTITRKKTVVLGILGLAAIGMVATPVVYASSLQDQINALSQQQAQKQDSKNQLGVQASSLQDAINQLQVQIGGLQAQISANEQKRDAVQAQITKAEADLAQQRAALGESLKAMYVDGSVSSLEMLASSQNINDFVDQEQYQQSVQGQVQRTLDSIKQLKAKLDNDKATLDKMLADLDAMRKQLASQQAEQSRLLSLNQQQQADLDAQIKADGAKLSDLRKQQAMENARLGGGKVPPGSQGGGGYPSVWANAGLDTMLDSWGMYNRECVSYTAYRVYASGRFMPAWGYQAKGNAKQWDDNARADGIPVDSNPRSGDVAISNAGAYGHAMYVEATGGDGSIYISDYNQQYDGLYREYWISADTVRSRGLVFIHF